MILLAQLQELTVAELCEAYDLLVDRKFTPDLPSAREQIRQALQGRSPRAYMEWTRAGRLKSPKQFYQQEQPQ